MSKQGTKTAANPLSDKEFEDFLRKLRSGDEYTKAIFKRYTQGEDSAKLLLEWRKHVDT